jgi:DNA replication protein DnaC
MARDPATELAVLAAREFIEDMDSRLGAGQGLWFVGDVGTGKTTLAMLVSKSALERGRSVAIYSMPNLLSRIRRTYDGEPGEHSYSRFFERLVSVDLLHIDDVGAQKDSEWVVEQLYAIVNKRYEAELSMILTMNIEKSDDDERDRRERDKHGDPEWVVQLRERAGPRTASRLIEMCEPVPLFGVDRRGRS